MSVDTALDAFEAEVLKNRPPQLGQESPADGDVGDVQDDDDNVVIVNPNDRRRMSKADEGAPRYRCECGAEFETGPKLGGHKRGLACPIYGKKPGAIKPDGSPPRDATNNGPLHLVS